MNRDIHSRLGFVLIEDLGDLLNGLVMSRICASEDDEDADGVLVDVLLHELCVEPVV